MEPLEPKVPAIEPATRQTQPSSGSLESELRELAGGIKQLIEKIDGQKKRDGWDKFQIIASFVSSVLFVAIGGSFTFLYDRREKAEADKIQESQRLQAEIRAQSERETQEAQIRIAELEAITTLTPLLASQDEGIRRYARSTLQAVQATGPVAGRVRPGFQLLDMFAATALSDDAPIGERKEAIQDLTSLALDPTTPADVREKATQIVTTVANSPTAPSEARSTAGKGLAQLASWRQERKIRSVTGDEIQEVVQAQGNSRRVEKVVLHHSFGQKIKQDNEREATVSSFSLLHLGWHYAIAPDGAIWLGMPLGVPDLHTSRSVGVVLILNGDKEEPTEPQQRSLAKLLTTLFDRFGIDPQTNFAAGRGVHRTYNSEMSCPGRLITSEKILGWLEASDS